MDMILKNTFQSISPAYELIGDVTVGTNTTQVDFNGLNIGKDDELLLVSDVVNPTGNNSVNQLTVNGVGAPDGGGIITQYYAQENTANGTSVAGNRTNNAYVYFTWPNSKSTSINRIRLANSGYFVWQSSNILYSGGTTPWLQNICGTSTFTSSSIASLKVITHIPNAIGVGSRFQLYKLVAEKVADIIVPSNTTSVDITGLNIGKDGEYMLTHTAQGTVSGTTSLINLVVNDNMVLTNYYHQQLSAVLNVVTAVHENNAQVFATDSADLRVTGYINIKLSNSGHYVAQSNHIRKFGLSGNGIEVRKHVVTSTFTVDNITKLSLLASRNQIGANSRFTLYKMK